MTPRLFVCTTCDRYAAVVESPTRGEALLAAVRRAAAERGVGHLVGAVACVMSCPRPNGAAVREGRGGGVFRFARLREADAPALVEFLVRRAADAAAPVPEGLADRVASYILPRS
jgi:predicted metal-binding protein